ncbi:hypothetical protein H5410_058554 [Solanum commersonii]|uniref:Uncharacterized protein n=1 Tax=Solanum commersonii TaxID=4109 RepID=A0A9J5WTG8_SOLCO|nr:hypothetical protein H5410_058554 [Solanum commersonii]
MEIGLAIGGAFLSSALNVLFDRLAPQGDLLNMFQKHKHHARLLKKLKMTLRGLQIVLSDAENKQASNPSVHDWLNELRDAVDSAENLIEEVNYEALRLKVEGQNLAETSNQQVSDLNLCLSDEFFLNIKNKLEDTIETLEVLEKQIGRLGLKEHFGSTKQETRTPSTSVVDDSDIFGRQNEIENLIDLLLSEDASRKKLTVVPIVGMGGLGKTTLAKAVYNDAKVSEAYKADHFGLKAWYCVSEAYDALRITKGLLQEIGLFDLKDDNNLNQLQVKLKESLKGKKFLIVLDDVWNDNYNEWDDLRNLFVQGRMGSKIIVTTRKESVALMMGNEQISMDNLSTEASWSLFKRHAFENMDPMGHPELEEVGKQIAAKCKGLPLALKTLAGMLRSKSEVQEWKRILRSEIWELRDKDILPALMLSYNDLPAHLKQCFSFCAIFPKDYPFRKEEVIHLWIANGLVPKEDEIIQDLGNQYFLELRSRSLLERVPNPSEGNIEKFLMHDLVNDLAQIVSSNLCIRLEENKGSHMLEQCWHLSYSMGDGDFEKLTPLYKLEHLRTLLPMCIDVNYSFLSKRVLHNILPRLTSLRALSLSNFVIKELPNDLFIKLKLLRFLDLSGARITKLPDSICGLYNLDTLLLSSCICLKELPLQMEKLINLRHLDISDTSCLKMPLHLSKLKSLQVLVGANFLLGGSRLEDVGEAQNLYGSLSIVELQNVVDRREPVKAKMREKNHVDRLSLKWSRSSSADNSQTERDILNELHPHRNIKEVEITGYRGTNFPNWLADPLFLKLVKLSLSYCKDCYSLPALGELPCLKFLCIRGMHGITEVTEDFYGSSSSKKPFNCLEKLEFVDMSEWKQWHLLGNGEFPTLEQLKIINCPEVSLETPIQLSCLKRFDVSGSPKVGVVFDDAQLLRSQLEGMKQIEELYISDWNSVTSFPFSILPTTLKTIRISDCPKLKLEQPVGEMTMFLEDLKLKECDCIDDISPELLPRARTLSVKHCHNLNRFLIPTATESLSIWNCENVEILSVACGGTQMTSLTILDCKKLKWLPERMQELLPSLTELYLFNCPEIESFPEGGLPFNLQLLKIANCKKLVNGRKEWRLQRLPCLTKLIIYHDGSDEEIVGGENWELPSSIQTLCIDNLKTLSSQHLKSLTSLQRLEIVGNLPQIQSMLEQGQFSSFLHLTSLQIVNFPNLQSLSESALPSSLSQLTISNCPNLQSLPVKGMPSSLSQLTIYGCPNLQSLPISEMEIGLAVGGAFLSSALNVLFERLAPHGDLLNMFRKRKDHVQLLKKLKMTLRGLQIVLSDAENKQASNPSVSDWLNELRDAVDSAENLIEEVNYEALRLKVEGQHQNLAETSNKQVSDRNLCLTDDFSLSIKEKLEETIETLEVLEKQIGRLGLKDHFGSTKQETRTPSTSVVDDSDIFGRQNEIENLIDLLLSEDASGKKLTVVPIVGMGGLGKTTLAKAVYNDAKVSEAFKADHFGLKAWYCVSEPYDALRITKGLLQEIGSFDSKDDNNLNQLQVKLKESLKGKKFLIVLDDVWNDNYNEWDDLRKLFVEGRVGSKIIVTTRKESVALIMGNEKISMDNLSTEDSWSLFKRHAFENMDPMGHTELEEVGKQIAAKCKGLPLALKTLAGMLRSKSEVEEWKRILRSELWELRDKDILPALMLSYNDLPEHLKRCFSFCAIFPKDYPFRKEQVIHLWIANGLVPKEDEIIEDSGSQYFLQLRSRSLLEKVPNPSKRNIEESFLMHDLVNDLAQIASSKLCIRLEESQGSHMLEKSWHLSYSMGQGGDFEKLTPLYKLEQLRTLLPTCIRVNYYSLSKRVLHNILPRLRSLRVLSLFHYYIKELPNDLFIKLKLLRFLDISKTAIKRLPDSMCVLYNLETLLLSSCDYLEELPLQMEKLINLRYLDISNTRLLKMPLHLSKLKSLQVLVGAKFLLGSWRMEDLGEVHNLYGSLSVVELQNVVDRREAMKAKMREKNHVDKLCLEWSESSSADNSQTERDILDELHPHKNIKEVKITGYRGTIFPNWLADPLFLKLVQLSIDNCKNCFSLPSLGQLPCLKILSIRGMHGITEVTEEFYGCLSYKKPFNCLEKLEFEDMPEWKQWDILGSGEFPTLEKLLIINCPELSLETPIQLSNLKSFKVWSSPKVGVLFEGMKQIQKLYISDCNSLTSLPFSILPTTLKTLTISGCKKLEAPVGEMSMFLEHLILQSCDCIDVISPELLPKARRLDVFNCQNLTRFLIPTATESLNIWNGANVEKLSVACGGTQMTSLRLENCSKLTLLPERGLPFNLQRLWIDDCMKLVNGRKEWRLQRLPCLKQLVIFHDGSDEEIVGGENWELPSSIQTLYIKNLKTLSSQHLKNLTSLQYLYIRGNLPQIQSMLEQGQFSSFLHLTSLQIVNFPNLQSLSESALPSSLSQLTISNCPNLQSLPVKGMPSSLSQLTIYGCPNLQSLPVKGMPSSLSKLSISNCPLLTPLLQFDKGEYWSNIAHISTIKIDEECL